MSLGQTLDAEFKRLAGHLLRFTERSSLRHHPRHVFGNHGIAVSLRVGGELAEVRPVVCYHQARLRPCTPLFYVLCCCHSGIQCTTGLQRWLCRRRYTYGPEGIPSLRS